MFLLTAGVSDQFVNQVLLFLLSRTSLPVVWICRRHLMPSKSRFDKANPMNQSYTLSLECLFFLYFLLNKAVSKLIGECKSTGKCQNDLATVLHLTLVPIMMKTYITIATFHIAIRLCSYCCMSRVIGQHNIQVEVLFPWGKKNSLALFSHS